MDLKCWVGNICQKFETVYLEVDEILSQEPLKYVENQLQTVSANVKQFCSEIIKDVLPPSSLDPVKVAVSDLPVNQNTDTTAHKKSNVKIINEDSKKELGNVNCWPNHSSVKSVKGEHFDSSSEQNVDDGLYEKSKVNFNENPIKENQCRPEIRHGQSDKEWDQPLQLDENLSSDVSSALPSSNSVTVESCEHEVPDIGLTLNDALSPESCERSDNLVIEETRNDEMNLAESCIMVDSNELCFLSSGVGKHKSYKRMLKQVIVSRMRRGKKQQATWSSVVDAESFTSSTQSELMKKEFNESEWEIV